MVKVFGSGQVFRSGHGSDQLGRVESRKDFRQVASGQIISSKMYSGSDKPKSKNWILLTPYTPTQISENEFSVPENPLGSRNPWLQSPTSSISLLQFGPRS